MNAESKERDGLDEMASAGLRLILEVFLMGLATAIVCVAFAQVFP